MNGPCSPPRAARGRYREGVTPRCSSGSRRVVRRAGTLCPARASWLRVTACKQVVPTQLRRKGRSPTLGRAGLRSQCPVFPPEPLGDSAIWHSSERLGANPILAIERSAAPGRGDHRAGLRTAEDLRPHPTGAHSPGRAPGSTGIARRPRVPRRAASGRSPSS